MEHPVIIEAAINGVTSKLQNINVPRLPLEIAEDALQCFSAGATIVHNHVDVVMVDGPTAAEHYLECWHPIWDVIPGALLYPTVNAGPVQQSFAHFPNLAAAGCRIGIVDAGSVNLGDFVYVNARTDIDYQVGLCAEHQLAPSLAIFEPGFLRIALRLWRAERLPPGAMIKLYFGGEDGYLGGVFGLPPTKSALEAYLSMLEGCPLPWSAAVIGGDVVESGIARMTLERGGHLHVGLEDWSGEGQPTNRELVEAAVSLCADVGRPVASHTQTVEALGLVPLP
ncbi:MAG: 3-keto-5-aminohexanoate cleavage protein [Acidimicrobiales bacterium]